MTDDQPWPFAQAVVGRAPKSARFYWLLRPDTAERYPKMGGWRLRPFRAPEAPQAKYLVYYASDRGCEIDCTPLGNTVLTVELTFPDPINLPDTLSLLETDPALRELTKEDAPVSNTGRNPQAERLRDARVDYHGRILAAKASDVEQRAGRGAILTRDVVELTNHSRGLRADLRSTDNAVSRMQIQQLEVMERTSKVLGVLQQQSLQNTLAVTEALKKLASPPQSPPPMNWPEIVNAVVGGLRDVVVTLVQNRKGNNDRAPADVAGEKLGPLPEANQAAPPEIAPAPQRVGQADTEKSEGSSRVAEAVTTSGTTASP